MRGVVIVTQSTLCTVPSSLRTQVAGDRCDTVRVQTVCELPNARCRCSHPFQESGSLESRLLVGVGGSLRLLESTLLSGEVAWSVNAGLLCSVVATAAAAETRPPFAVRFEGPDFCLECWCRDDEAMNGWLRWVRHLAVAFLQHWG
jgi:hypothetical protein